MRRPPTACQGVIPPVTEPSHAVFLSYASQDAEAAQRICEALRAAGIEVWLDQSELRGGDVWDQTIRKQIKTCVLFIPVISRHTHEREEGYFRLEWKLAVDRSHLMTTNKAFLLPVVVDDTREDDENVPDRFRDIHWTRLPGGETPSDFIERVRRLISPELPRPTSVSLAVPGSAGEPLARDRLATPWSSKLALSIVLAVVVAGALTYFGIDRFALSKYRASPPTPLAALAPPPHSIAVLPFVNMSGDKGQEYFSDGLTEEILNSLARINELQVSARTSSFSFKGTNADISTIAHKLNVASVLEGSVRRSGRTVRITAQLNNAVTGFHLWSETYDRDLSDVLKVQTEIASAVASALKVTLLGDLAAKIEVGGTHNPGAFDAYLRGSKAFFTANNEKDVQAAIATFTDAIRLDPNYALAYADRSIAFTYFAETYHKGATHDYLDRAKADATKATSLAPDLANGHIALGYLAAHSLDLTRASQEGERALALAPGDARVLRDYGKFAVQMGHIDAGLAAAHRAVALDPLNPENHSSLGECLLFARRYKEAVAAFTNAKALAPTDTTNDAMLGYAYYASGSLESARSACASADEVSKLPCLAIVYDKLGRHAEAKAMLAKLRAAAGDGAAASYAIIYAQWGDTARALDQLELALRIRDFELLAVKEGFVFDPLRKEPRFQAIERELKFPD